MSWPSTFKAKPVSIGKLKNCDWTDKPLLNFTTVLPIMCLYVPLVHKPSVIILSLPALLTRAALTWILYLLSASWTVSLMSTWPSILNVPWTRSLFPFAVFLIIEEPLTVKVPEFLTAGVVPDETLFWTLVLSITTVAPEAISIAAVLLLITSLFEIVIVPASTSKPVPLPATEVLSLELPVK